MIEQLTSERGKYERTKETRLKQHLSMVGKLAKSKNPKYIDGRCLEVKFCLDCKKELKSYKAQRCRSCATKFQLKKKNHLKEVDRTGTNNGMFGVRRFGKNNPNYKINKEFRPYPLGWNKTYKEQIRYRDGYKCQNCGSSETECLVKLHVHHIDYKKDNIQKSNLISLCHNCHAKTTVSQLDKKIYWYNYYKVRVVKGD